MGNVVALHTNSVADYNETPLLTIQMLLETCQPARDGFILGYDPLDTMSLLSAAACYIAQYMQSGYQPENYYEILDEALTLACGVPVVNGIRNLPLPRYNMEVLDYMTADN